MAYFGWPAAHDDNPWLWLNGMSYVRISAGSEKDSWQNLYNLVQRTAHGSAYSADVFARLADYYRHLGYPRQANTFFRLAWECRCTNIPSFDSPKYRVPLAVRGELPRTYHLMGRPT